MGHKHVLYVSSLYCTLSKFGTGKSKWCKFSRMYALPGVISLALGLCYEGENIPVMRVNTYLL